MALLADVFTDLSNWIRDWDRTVFIIVIVAFAIIMLALLIALIKGFISSKPKFRFVYFLFLAIIVGLTIYICLVR